MKKFVQRNDVLMAVAEDESLSGESEPEEQATFVEPGSGNQHQTSHPDTPESATAAPIPKIQNTRADEGAEYGKTAARLQWEEQARQHIPGGKRFAIVVGGGPTVT